MSKAILILTKPIPYSKIGSWTTMYNYYIENTKHQFDFIVCPQPNAELIKGIEYSLVKDKTFLTKLKTKINPDFRWANYFKALDNIIQSDEKYVIQIVDNSGFVVPLNKHIRSKYKRENFYIQYFDTTQSITSFLTYSPFAVNAKLSLIPRSKSR